MITLFTPFHRNEKRIEERNSAAAEKKASDPVDCQEAQAKERDEKDELHRHKRGMASSNARTCTHMHSHKHALELEMKQTALVAKSKIGTAPKKSNEVYTANTSSREYFQNLYNNPFMSDCTIILSYDPGDDNEYDGDDGSDDDNDNNNDNNDDNGDYNDGDNGDDNDGDNGDDNDGDSKGGEIRIAAHKLVLSGSPYFKKLLSCGTQHTLYNTLQHFILHSTQLVPHTLHLHQPCTHHFPHIHAQMFVIMYTHTIIMKVSRRVCQMRYANQAQGQTYSSRL